MTYPRILLALIMIVLPFVTTSAQRKVKTIPVSLTASVRELVSVFGDEECANQIFERDPAIGRTTVPVSLKVEDVTLSPGPLTYEYNVTGGNIRGTGTTATWDLSNVAPGDYSATVSVENGTDTMAIGTVTVQVTRRFCESKWFGIMAFLKCPNDEVEAGKHARISADISRPRDITKLVWTVSAGRILSGQGTPEIVVDTAGIEGPISVTLELPEVPPFFTQMYSCAFFVRAPPRPTKLDQFALITVEDALARTDAYAVALMADSNARGHIIVYNDRCGSVRIARSQLRRTERLVNSVRNYLFKNRGIARDRIVFTPACRREGVVMEFYLVPPGASPPAADPN